MGSPGSEKLNLDTLIGKTVAVGESGNQFVSTGSPFSIGQISRAVAQISGTENSNSDPGWRSTEATSAGGRNSESTIPGSGGHGAAPFLSGGNSEQSSPSNDTPSPQLPGSLAEASDELKLSHSCK